LRWTIGKASALSLEHEHVVWRTEAQRAAKMSPEQRLVRPASNELEAPRPHRRIRSALREIRDPGKDDVGHQSRRRVVREHPLEAQAGLAIRDIDGDLLGAHETLVPGELP